MSRPAVSIRRQGGWTFGSPSVLMMFHRQAGRLDCELAEMDECMPHYYCVTNGHGQGAEHIMRGEAAFLRGQLDDARIALAGAYAQIRDNGQENMALCCDHLAWRLSLCTGETPRQDFDQRRRELLCQHNAAWRVGCFPLATQTRSIFENNSSVECCLLVVSAVTPANSRA